MCKLVDLVRFCPFQVRSGAVRSAPRVGRSGSRSTFDEIDFFRFGIVLGLDFARHEPTLGSSLALSGRSLGVLRHSWGAPGGLKGALGGSWGVSCGSPGRLLGCSWALLGALGRPLGPRWLPGRFRTSPLERKRCKVLLARARSSENAFGHSKAFTRARSIENAGKCFSLEPARAPGSSENAAKCFSLEPARAPGVSCIGFSFRTSPLERKRCRVLLARARSRENDFGHPQAFTRARSNKNAASSV